MCLADCKLSSSRVHATTTHVSALARRGGKTHAHAFANAALQQYKRKSNFKTPNVLVQMLNRSIKDGAQRDMHYSLSLNSDQTMQQSLSLTHAHLININCFGGCTWCSVANDHRIDLDYCSSLVARQNAIDVHYVKKTFTSMAGSIHSGVYLQW